MSMVHTMTNKDQFNFWSGGTQISRHQVPGHTSARVKIEFHIWSGAFKWTQAKWHECHTYLEKRTYAADVSLISLKLAVLIFLPRFLYVQNMLLRLVLALIQWLVLYARRNMNSASSKFFWHIDCTSLSVLFHAYCVYAFSNYAVRSCKAFDSSKN